MDAQMSLDHGRAFRRLYEVKNIAVKKEFYMIPATTKYTTIHL